MGFFNKKRTDGKTSDNNKTVRRGLIDVIQHNGTKEDIVWKFPYNNISSASQLIVNASQEAIFVRGGIVCDVFGPGTHTLSTSNLPLLDKIVNLPFGGNTPFVAEIWYVNKTIKRGLKFGTPSPIRVIDPMFGSSNVSIPIRAHGDYSIRVSDSTLLLNSFVGTLHEISTNDIIDKFSSLVVQELNKQIKTFSRVNHISPLDFPDNAENIAICIKEHLQEKFDIYGITIEDFQFSHIAPNENDATVKELYNNRIKAVTEVERRAIQGISYEQERKFNILETAAGNQGNVGNIMGVGIGLSMGQGANNMFRQQFESTSQIMEQSPTPPPVVASPYFVYINNTQQGPFDLETLKTLVSIGALSYQTLVWRQGMTSWEPAGAQTDLSSLFS